MGLTAAGNGKEAAAAGFAKAREAFRTMTASRLGFAQFFDAYLADATSTAAVGRPLPRTFLHAVFVGRHALAGSGESFDPAIPVDAAALALVAMGGPEAMWDVAMAGVGAGLFDPAPDDSTARSEQRTIAARGISKVFGSEVIAQRRAAALSTDNQALEDVPAPGSTAQLQRATLEVFTVMDETLPDPDSIGAALLLARKRLCRIETVGMVEGQLKPVTGTGFLVGPSAVLTNWHVIRDVPSPRGDTPLRVIFDYGQTTGIPTAAVSVVQARDSWRIESSEAGPLEPQGATEGWWLDQAERLAWRQSHSGNLDFAVIHVEGAPGLQRGYYDLATAEQALADGTCFVLHHPSSQGRTLTAGHFRFSQETLGYRVFHTASTAKGSSGGLVLDTNGRPTAIHYLGLGEDALTPASAASAADRQINVAVPLKSIAAKLAPELQTIKAFDGLALAGGCLAMGRPVFGRQNLLDALAALKKGDKRVLSVQPPSGGAYQKPGKSYTVEILEALFPAPESLFIKVTADQVKHGAKAMAEMILNALSTSAAKELPDPETTESAYDQVLVGRLREIFADRWPNNLIWLVIDDLDVHDLTDAGGRQLLNMLYSRVAEIPQLRIVLIGLKVRLDTIPPDQLVDSPIREDELSDVASLFKQWVAVRGARDKPIDDAVLDMIAAALASYAGAERPLETLGQFTADHLSAPLTKLFGK